MTNTTTNTSGTPAPATTDIRDLFTRSVSTARPVIAGVRSDQLDRPTPCDLFDVHQITDHLVGVLEKLPRFARLEPPSFQMPSFQPGDWLPAWDRAAAETAAEWADDALLEQTIDVGWAKMPGAQTMAIYLNEIVVHTWDLAQATGQPTSWDDEVLQTALDAMVEALPAAGRSGSAERPAAPFAEVVPVPAKAPLVDRLVAWTGRDPRWG